MESRLAWISEREAFDVEAFLKAFDYETEESALRDVQDLTKNTRLPGVTRQEIQRSFKSWLDVNRGTFWEDQKKHVVAKKALSNAQSALIDKADKLVPDTLDKATESKQVPIPPSPSFAVVY